MVTYMVKRFQFFFIKCILKPLAIWILALKLHLGILQVIFAHAFAENYTNSH